MAAFGLRYPCFKAEDESAGTVIGKAVSANLTVNFASGELYADDALDEQVSEFASGSLALETNDMEDDVAGKIYGCTVSEGLVTYNKNDTAPRGVLAYYKVLQREGKKFYKAYVYPQAQAALGNDNGQTRGSNITFQTTTTTFTIFADADGDWRETKTFDTEAAAAAYVRNATSVPDVSGGGA